MGSRGLPGQSNRVAEAAESYSLPAFRQRLLGHLAEVVARATPEPVPPAPHLARNASAVPDPIRSST